MFRYPATVAFSLCLLPAGMLPAVSRAETAATVAMAPPAGPMVSVPGAPAIPVTAAAVSSLNQMVLNQIATMPALGGYAVSHDASVRLANAVRLDAGGRFLVEPTGARPSYCSGATYLVFLKTIATLRAAGQVPNLDQRALEALLIRGQRDGEGVWGRWNANGPGTARLFSALGLGRNFTRIEDAQPGDFMKVFWTPAVGKKEHGHSVIFQGLEGPEGARQVRFWSSNQGKGYGEKTVPLSKVNHAIFSRLEHPDKLADVGRLPVTDDYLASLLTKESSVTEARENCRAR